MSVSLTVVISQTVFVDFYSSGSVRDFCFLLLLFVVLFFFSSRYFLLLLLCPFLFLFYFFIFIFFCVQRRQQIRQRASIVSSRLQNACSPVRPVSSVM